MWNRAGIRPPVCDRLERAAQIVNPDARVWRGSHLPTERRGIKVLGTPDFVARHPQAVAAEHQTTLDWIPRVKDLQCAWLLLLHCASARANYQLRAVSPTSTAQFAQVHDVSVWQCLCTMLWIEPTQTANVRDIASLPLVLGELGLGRAGRSRVPAHWASWADCLPMIFERQRAVAERLIRQLEGVPTKPCLHAAASAGQSLDAVLGWSPPSWTALANGERPESRPPEELEPGARS